MTSSIGNFHLLPREITLEILYFLSIEEWKTSACVCKFFKNIVKNQDFLKKHPGYPNYLRNKVSANYCNLICKDAKFFNALIERFGKNNSSYAQGIVQGYLWCYLYSENKEDIEEAELEILKTGILEAKYTSTSARGS